MQERCQDAEMDIFPGQPHLPLIRANVDVPFRPEWEEMSRQVILNSVSNRVDSPFKWIGE